MSYTVQIGFTGAGKTYTVLESGFNFTERVGAKGKHVTQSISVQIHSAEAVGLFLTETKRYIPVTLFNGSTAIFEGVTRPYQKVSAYSNYEDNFSFEIMDLTERMNDNITPSAYLDKTVSYIISQLLTMAGITVNSMVIPSDFGNRVLPYVSFAEGQSIATALSDFLFEYGYDFRFSIGTINIIPTTTNSTPSNNIRNIRGKLSVSRADDWSDGITAKYQRYVARSGRFTLYNPSTIRFDWALSLLQTFDHFNAEGIFYDDKMYINQDQGSSSWVNDRIILDYDITKNSTPPTGKGKISWSFNDIVSKEGGKTITPVSITGVQISGSMVDENGVDCAFHHRNDTLSGCEYWISYDGNFENWFGTGWGWDVSISAQVSYLVGESEDWGAENASSSQTKPSEVSLKYISAEADAKAYAQREYKRQQKSNFTYSWTSRQPYTVGEFYNLSDTSVTGISSVVRILSVKYNFRDEIYEITAESAYTTGLSVSVERLALQDLSGVTTAGLMAYGDTSKVDVGESVNVKASGLLTQIENQAISYKWYLNGIEITGATGLDINLDFNSLLTGNNTITVKAFAEGVSDPIRTGDFTVRKVPETSYEPPKFLGALAAAPSDSKEGDYYVDVTTGKIWQKQGAVWGELTATNGTADQFVNALNALKEANIDLTTISSADSVTWFTDLISDNVVSNRIKATEGYFNDINISGSATFQGSILCDQITTVDSSSGDNTGVTITPNQSTDNWNVDELFFDNQIAENSIIESNISGTYQGSLNISKFLKLTNKDVIRFPALSGTSTNVAALTVSCYRFYPNIQYRTNVTFTSSYYGASSLYRPSIAHNSDPSPLARNFTGPVTYTMNPGDYVSISKVWSYEGSMYYYWTSNAISFANSGFSSNGVYIYSPSTWTYLGTKTFKSTSSERLTLSGAITFDSNNAKQYRYPNTFITYNKITSFNIAFQLQEITNSILYNNVQKTPAFFIKKNSSEATIICTDGTAIPMVSNQYVSLSGTIKVAGTLAGVKMQGLYPVAHDTYNIGNSSSYWKNGYITTLNVTNVNSNNVKADIEEYTTLGGTSTIRNVSVGASVVETYHSGAYWYRLYSDGWIEQGGITTSTTNATITLFKNFSNTNYNVFLTKFSSYTATGSQYETPKINAKTISNFTYVSNSDYGTQWFACGY